MNELKKFCDKNPGLMKTYIADKLGISKQCLHYWLTIGKNRSLTVELKAKVRALR
jgi:hypothetical protein